MAAQPDFTTPWQVYQKAPSFAVMCEAGAAFVTIMPCDYSLYPADWNERRARVLARAGNCCEFCKVPNREAIYRRKDDRLKWRGPNGADLCEEDPDYRATWVILTIAHLDRTGAPGTVDGPLDCPDDRLAALCQACHLHLDRYRHQAKAAATRRAKAGLTDLFA